MIDRFRRLVQRYLVPDRVITPTRAPGQDRVLIYIHLIALAAGVANVVMEYLLHARTTPAVVAFCVLVVGLLLIFRRYGNLVLSGNLLAATMAAILMEGIGESGGLYSDNLLWLLLVPVTAFLFASRRWGVVWSVGLVVVLAGLYLLERHSVESYRYASLEYSASYYFVSYLGLFAGVLGVILLFVRSNDETLAQLLATTEQLRVQEAETAAQNELLRAKESELKRSNRDLELFAYVASHDLKEPLRMVASYAQLLQRDLGGDLAVQQRGYLGFVTEGASRMQTMLDDLLNYSRLGRERQAEQDVELDKVMLLVGNFLRERLEASGGAIEVMGPLPVVRSRTSHLIQVFQNLIANAIKFVPVGRPPKVIVRASVTEDGSVAVSVEDNGIGIRAEDTARIFGVFQRLHRREEYAGSGIGLATVKRIVEGLGGRVEVESSVGNGTCFTVIFPPARVVARASGRS